MTTTRSQCVKCGLPVYRSNTRPRRPLVDDLTEDTRCPGFRLPTDQRPEFPYNDHHHEIPTTEETQR